jgi:glycosyltransferase involved in cell wall biosynthesis
MRTAFVHDWLSSYTGAEKVLEHALELFPGTPIYTLVYHKENFTTSRISQHPIHTSLIEKLPRGRSKYRAYLPLMPYAIEQFDLNEYDLIISSSHAVAKGALTRSDQLHISYVHTPIRYAWDLQHQYLKEANLERGIRSLIARIILHYIRLWDQSSAHRVDVYAANSHYVARRICKFYGKSSTVIYPPVEIDQFELSTQREDFYLTVSRFVPYKKVGLIIEAFNRLNLPLIVIGDGPEWDSIRARAGGNIQLLGQQSTHELVGYMQRCKAFVFAANEDFGIAPVEAQATGAPVIAYGRGGVTETVIPGSTGIFFDEQSPESLAEAVHGFEQTAGNFDPDAIRQNAARFGSDRFREQFHDFVMQSWAAFQAPKSL